MFKSLMNCLRLKKSGSDLKILSFLVSGRGSNFEAVAEAVAGGRIRARLGVVISDKEDAAALEKAKKYGMETYWLDPSAFKSRHEYDKNLAALLQEAGTDLVIAAGYMRLLSSEMISIFKNRIINIHPSLLPAFPGVKAQKQALEYGVRIAGCTAHLIDEGTDTGPIIMQAAVTVRQKDTEKSLSKKILKEEHRILVEAVRLFCEDRLQLKGRTVIIKE